MSDVLVIWDNRVPNERLSSFIEEVAGELYRYSLSARIVSFSMNPCGESQIKASMRALLDLVHKESPLHLITFGRKANSLASLISPALRCQLHTNKLPEWMEDSKSGATMAKIASYIHKEDIWGSNIDVNNYFFPCIRSQSSATVAFFVQDSFARVIEHHIVDHGYDHRKVSINDFLKPKEQEIAQCGIMVMSSDLLEEYGNLVELSNGYGVPVLLISNDHRHHGIKEGQTGWVVATTQQIHFSNYLKNWRGMSQNAREMISHYCCLSQSGLSGIQSYCSSLGYPEKLELKDFKLRG